jgi:hypothetical protein
LTNVIAELMLRVFRREFGDLQIEQLAGSQVARLSGMLAVVPGALRR